MSMPEYRELDEILDDVRTRFDETPQWEFCEGFMAALICCRRLIPPSEYFPMLLGTDTTNDEGQGAFADEAQFARFMTLWVKRWNQIAESLDADAKAQGAGRGFMPQVMDVRGSVALLTPEERTTLPDGEPPSFAQVWAIGFMSSVESWLDDWNPPRDRKAAVALDDSLQAILDLTDDDVDPPIPPRSSDDPDYFSVSRRRLEEFSAAVGAVYDMRDLWRSLGPRVEPVRKDDKPGRNDPCFCGSGKKYKKCHGANP
jgi:uncharacterized protein